MKYLFLALLLAGCSDSKSGVCKIVATRDLGMMACERVYQESASGCYDLRSEPADRMRYDRLILGGNAIVQSVTCFNPTVENPKDSVK